MPLAPTSYRFGFQTKVLAPMLLLLVLLPATTLWVVTSAMGRQLKADERATLKTAEAVFANSLKIRKASLETRFRSVVKEPRFRAIASVSDEKTKAAFLRENLADYLKGAEAISFSDANGNFVAGQARDPDVALPPLLKGARPVTNRALEGEVAFGMIAVGRQIFEVVAVPLMNSDNEVVCVLTVAVRFGRNQLQELKRIANTEIAVLAHGAVADSTLDDLTLVNQVTAGFAQGNQVQAEPEPVDVEDRHYFALEGSFAEGMADSGLRYLLMVSYDERLRESRATRAKFIGISAAGVLIGMFSISFFIRKVTRPLRLLRDEAEAIGRGDFTRRVLKISGDECGDLSASFNTMAGNLQASRGEIEQTVDTLRTTEVKLRESKEQLRLVIESARDHMILTFDADGHVMSWNPTAGRLLGYIEEEALGMVYGLLFDAADRAAGRPAQVLATALAEGRSAFEGWRVRHDGTRFWADVTVSRISPANQASPAGFVEIARDVSDRKEAEEALRQARDAAEVANRAKSEFLANMTHELRTPMNAIIGLAGLLQDKVSSGENANCVHTIHSSANDLLTVIDNILDIAHLDSGRIALAPSAFDPLACLEGVADLFAGRCAEKGLELAAFVEPGVPSSVVADERRLRQILTALVGNGLKFTDTGSITVTLAYRAGGEFPGLEFRVEDTGIGIAEAKQRNLFKPFFQVESAANRRFGGSGLGLAITQHLVTLMGGRIRVESQPGQGSCFTFSVAVAEAGEDFPGFTPLLDKRVLVVAEGLGLADQVGRQLGHWDLAVESVGGGSAAALEWLSRGWRGDLILQLAAGNPARGTPSLARMVQEGFPELENRVLRLAPRDEATEGAAPCASVLKRPLKPRSLYAALKSALQPEFSGDARTALPADERLAKLIPLNILVAEDNPVNLKVALMLLRRLGYQPEWVENGRCALEQMQAKAYDLVLMDLQMPEMDGLEAIRLFRAVVPATQPPFICALTANGTKEDRAACVAVGMHQFMAKPVQLSKFVDLVAQLAPGWK